jgi:hypothetical protein
MNNLTPDGTLNVPGLMAAGIAVGNATGNDVQFTVHLP